MNKLLRDLTNIGKVGSLINDIMVETESEKEHNELVKKILKENNLYVKPEKCKWKIRKIDFLGVVIRPEEIKIEEEKVKAVLDWPVSKLVKDVQKFLRLVNYYRRFVKGFSKIVRPLHELTKKGQKLEWEIKQENLFKALKKMLIIELILVVLDLNRKVRMEVNASDYVMMGVLSIECNNKQ